MMMQPRGSRHYSPHPYQEKAIKMMLGQACGGLLLDPGLGKTSISLAVSKVLLELGYIKGVLVIAPLRAVYNVWPNEVKKWKEFEGMSIGIMHGSDKDKVFKQELDIYVTNFESIDWLVSKLTVQYPKMEDWPFDMLIVDESTKLKDSGTKRFKAMRKILHKFQRRYILTGTVTPNGLMDLFGQAFVMDLGHSLGSYITHFRNTYFYQSGFGGYTWSPLPGSMERIGERLAPLVLRMRAEDYLDLPELTQDMIWLKLPSEARAIYKSLEDEFIALIGEDTVVAPSAAAAGVKCRQVLNGAIYTNAQHDWRLVHDVKMQALEDLVEQLSGAPLLVLYEFEHDKERILRKFQHCAQIGGQSMAKDNKVIEAFNAGLVPMVLGHPASMGHALNLQGTCAHVCWFGLTWNYEYYDQAIKRVWRQGNDAPRVIVYHLCIEDSLDEVVVQTLYNKDKTQTKFTEFVRGLRQ